MIVSVQTPVRAKGWMLARCPHCESMQPILVMCQVPTLGANLPPEDGTGRRWALCNYCDTKHALDYGKDYATVDWVPETESIAAFADLVEFDGDFYEVTDAKLKALINRAHRSTINATMGCGSLLRAAAMGSLSLGVLSVLGYRVGIGFAEIEMAQHLFMFIIGIVVGIVVRSAIDTLREQPELMSPYLVQHCIRNRVPYADMARVMQREKHAKLYAYWTKHRTAIEASIANKTHFGPT